VWTISHQGDSYYKQFVRKYFMRLKCAWAFGTRPSNFRPTRVIRFPRVTQPRVTINVFYTSTSSNYPCDDDLLRKVCSVNTTTLRRSNKIKILDHSNDWGRAATTDRSKRSDEIVEIFSKEWRNVVSQSRNRGQIKSRKMYSRTTNDGFNVNDGTIATLDQRVKSSRGYYINAMTIILYAQKRE